MSKVRITGVRQAIHKLTTLINVSGPIVDEELRTLSTNIVIQARELAPRSTEKRPRHAMGTLQQGITVTMKPDFAKPGIVAKSIAKAPYKGRFNYAPIQHENEQFSHEVGGPHYLSIAVHDQWILLAKRLRERIKQSAN